MDREEKAVKKLTLAVGRSRRRHIPFANDIRSRRLIAIEAFRDTSCKTERSRISVGGVAPQIKLERCKGLMRETLREKT